MGMDIEIVAYRGRAVSNAKIAALISRFAPDTEWFRHGVASAARKPILPDLHCIACYESVRRDDDAKPKGQGLYFSESMLRDLRQRAGGPDRSLASLVQAAWAGVREEIRKQPAKPTPAVETTPAAVAIARELGKLCGEAFLVGYGDHSCTGIYGQFRDGELVAPAAERDVYREHDDYTTAPARAWSAALGRKVTIDDAVRAYFSDDKQPPLRAVDKPTRAIPFDGSRFRMTLVE
jgi:uncharacterized small protein (TIGR04563 family)